MNDAVEPAHYEYGAASAKRWTSCLASVRECRKCPSSQDSEWGKEGRQAHALLELCLMFGENTAGNYLGVNVLNGVAHETAVTHDMARAVQVALDYIYDICRQFPDAVISIENKVKVPSVVAANRMGGTYDARIYIPSVRWLIVIDYKHGAGIFVEEEDNLQMLMYDIASLFSMDEGIERITNTIIQPRSFVAGGAVRSADVTVAEVLAKHAWFEEKARAAEDPNAPYAPSPDNCRWCPPAGYGTCVAADRSIIDALDPGAGSLMKVNLPKVGEKISYERMAWLLTNEKLITSILKNNRMTATGMVRNGADFPGFKMVLGKSERAWYGDHLVIAAQLMLLLNATIDDVMPRVLIPLTEAENRLVDMFRSQVNQMPGETKKAYKVRQNEASELARETLAMMTLKQPSGQPSLVPITDDRPALNTSVPHFAGQISLPTEPK